MKKFIAASAALAIVLTGAPQAAAFSSMSSSSPAISKPAPSPKPTTPKPTTPKPTTPAPTTPAPTTPEPTTPAPAPADPEEVYAAIYSGHTTAFKNRGYTWAEPAMKLMQIYAQSSPVTRPYQNADLEAQGYTVTVVEHKTSDFRKDYAELMATPTEPRKYKLFGLYVVYGEETTTAYILNS